MSLFSRFSRTFGAIKPAVKPAKIVKVSPRVSDLAVKEAQAQAREIILEAKDEAFRIKQALVEGEAILKQKQQSTQEKLLEVETKLKQAEELRKKRQERLEQVAGLTKEEAKKRLLAELDEQLAEDAAKMIRASEEKAQEEAEEKAKEILVDAMKHGATDYVAEYTVSAVKLPDDEIKGRIIGKEGRNIRSFERATGVDVDLDETPGEVRLSSFDPIRREVARMALNRLVTDGRIQPSRIEEYVAKARQEIQRITFEEGKRLAHMVGMYNLPRELLEYLGKFKYRFSYGQNMIAHTLEETKIGIALAKEVGARVDVVKLACLLHDIGKVITDEEGSHVELGVKLLQRLRLPSVVIDCVAQHHEDTAFTSKEAVLVYIADAISGARPGARYEDYEEYVKRLSKLEELARSFSGVAEAYAIQAGREVRIMVNPKEINDAQAVKLAQDLKTRIQKELTYPGTVKINVIREVRATEVAT